MPKAIREKKPISEGRQAWIEKHNPEVCACGVALSDQEGPLCDDCRDDQEVR
jgi:hypothetical protein